LVRSFSGSDEGLESGSVDLVSNSGLLFGLLLQNQLAKSAGVLSSDRSDGEVGVNSAPLSGTDTVGSLDHITCGLVVGSAERDGGVADT
jgi:hypothetical protein